MRMRVLGSGILVGIFVLGAPGSPASFRQKRPTPAPAPGAMTIELLLPQDVLAAIFIRDLAAFRSGIRESPFAQAVAGTPLFIGRYLREVGDRVDPSSLTLWGPDARYAVVVPELSDPPRPVVLVETSSPQMAMRAFERVRASLARLGSVRSVEGKSVPLLQVSLSPPGDSLSATQMGRVLLLGPTSALERLIESRGPTLAELPSFRQAREQCAPAPAFAFVNLERLIPEAFHRLASSSGGSIPLLVPALQLLGLPAFKALGLSLSFEKGIAREEYCVIVDRAQSAIISAVTDLPAIEFATTQAIAEDAALLVIGGLDFDRLYEALLRTFAPLITAQLGVSSPESAIALLEGQLGFRLKDELLASLGREVGAFWHPLPDRAERVLLLSVRQPERLRAILEKAAARQSARPTTYKEHTLYPLTEDLSVVVTGSEAILARTEYAIKLLDAREQGRTLMRNSDFARWISQRPPQGALALYATSAALRLPGLRPLLAGARSDEAPPLPPVLFSGFGMREPWGIRVTLTSTLSPLVLGDAWLAARSNAPERSLLGALARLIRMIAEDVR